MSLAVWRTFQELLRHPRRRLLGLVAVTFVGGIAEALVLVLVVAVAVGMAADSTSVELRIPLTGDFDVAASTALSVSFFASIAVVIVHFVTARVVASMSADVLSSARIRSIKAFSRAQWSRQAQEREGAIQDTVTTLAIQSSTVALHLGLLVSASVSLVALLIVAVAVDPMSAAVVILAGVVAGLAMRPLARATQMRSMSFVTGSSKFAAEVSEWSSLAMELRAFGVMDVGVDRLDGLIRESSTDLFRSRFMSRFGSFVYKDFAIFMLVVAVALVFVFSPDNLSQIGAIAVIVTRAVNYGQNVQTSRLAINELGPNLVALDTHIHSLEGDRHHTGSEDVSEVNVLELRHVNYEYIPERLALADVSFEIRSGESVGVIGPSGGGKSTLAQVILRLRPPTGGELTVNGIPYERLSAARWHRLVAYVPQEPRLFLGSIAENIMFFRSGFSEANVRRAAEQAHIDDEIMQLPDGYATRIGPRGLGLSGGQRQRLSVARALIGQPDLIVLDEPTSALDRRSEALLTKTLAELKGQTALLIIAHRLTTLAVCDRLLVMRDGRCSTAADLDEALTLSDGLPEHSVFTAEETAR